jgi:hypothetical protein
VNAACQLQVELVGDLAHVANHLEGPEELEGELVVCAPGHRGLDVGLQARKTWSPMENVRSQRCLLA